MFIRRLNIGSTPPTVEEEAYNEGSDGSRAVAGRGETRSRDHHMFGRGDSGRGERGRLWTRGERETPDAERTALQSHASGENLLKRDSGFFESVDVVPISKVSNGGCVPAAITRLLKDWKLTTLLSRRRLHTSRRNYDLSIFFVFSSTRCCSHHEHRCCSLLEKDGGNPFLYHLSVRTSHNWTHIRSRFSWQLPRCKTVS